MRVSELEAWVLTVLRATAEGRRSEDVRVELKSDWPQPTKAARRLAGHLNAARGEPVLWIIGIDESKGVVPVLPEDTSAWLKQVLAEFDSIGPSVIDLVVPTLAGQVIALLFTGERVPFVVRNPEFGRTGSGPVALEVPWREGTAVSSATRSQLLSILVPAQRLPDLELLDGSVSAEKSPGLDSKGGSYVPPGREVSHCWWTVDLTIYVTPRTSEMLVLPVHRTTVTIRVKGDIIETDSISVHTPHRYAGHSFVPDSNTISTTMGEALIHGAGRLQLRASIAIAGGQPPDAEHLMVRVTFLPAGDHTVAAVMDCSMRHEPAEKGRKWGNRPLRSHRG